MTGVVGARRQFTSILVARMGAAAIQATVGIGLARLTGPADYGQITSFAGAMLFWFIVCDVGISSYTPRARALGRAASVSTALLINVGSSLIGAVAGLLFLAGPADLSLAPALALIVVGLAFDKNVDAAMGIMVADGEHRFPAVSVLLRRGLTAVVFYLAVVAGVDPVWAYGGAMLLGPAVGQVHMRLKLAALGVRLGRDAGVANVLGSASFFAINDIANQSRTLDTAIVAATSSVSMAGVYAGAAKLIAPFELAASTLAGVVMPRAARAEAATVKRWATWLAVAAVAAFVPSVPLAWAVSPIATVVLGDEYAGAVPTLAYLLMGLPFIAVSSPLAALLQAHGRERFVAANGTVFAVTSLLAVLVGSLAGGSTGAAIGISAVSALKVLSLFVRLRRDDLAQP